MNTPHTLDPPSSQKPRPWVGPWALRALRAFCWQVCPLLVCPAGTLSSERRRTLRHSRPSLLSESTTVGRSSARRRSQGATMGPTMGLQGPQWCLRHCLGDEYALGTGLGCHVSIHPDRMWGWIGWQGSLAASLLHPLHALLMSPAAPPPPPPAYGTSVWLCTSHTTRLLSLPSASRVSTVRCIYALAK